GKFYVIRKNRDGSQKDAYFTDVSSITIPESENSVIGTGLTGLSVVRQGHTLAYDGSFVATDGKRSQIDGAITVHPDGKTATYESHQAFAEGGSAHFRGVFKKIK